MRPIALPFLISFSALPAHGAVTQDQALPLCVLQPALQVAVAPAAREMSAADQKTRASACAAEMIKHPDAFDVLNDLTDGPDRDWQAGWYAFNVTCAPNLSGSCVSAAMRARGARH